MWGHFRYEDAGEKIGGNATSAKKQLRKPSKILKKKQPPPEALAWGNESMDVRGSLRQTVCTLRVK